MNPARAPVQCGAVANWTSSAGWSLLLAENDPAVQHDDQYTSLLLALIGRRREALLEWRDAQRIDDLALRRLLARLDIDEVRLLGAHPLE
jgi:CPA1 family monovalent cation:H+ antiporter